MAPRVRKTVTPPSDPPEPVADYRFDAARKNIPPAGLAAQGKLAEPKRIRYDYDPRRPPLLRFDASGAADRVPELLETARQRALTEEEVRLLAEALRVRQPWLEWAGKREQRSFEVEPVALHIHERIAAQAIVKVAARQDVQRDLFADPQLSYREAVQFYQHDIDWANRMILCDSLQVMASLARRGELAGRVRMIYVDPPYGIKFASNFQPEVGKRDVKDKESDLTREPEMVKAYRDTWTLGVHSYLAYLRDRLILAKELLADSGSIFVQISDENLHRVRCVMDEVFGAENFVAGIVFSKTTGATVEAFLDRMIRLLAQDGVRFPNNKTAAFSRLSPIGEDFLHAEGEWSNDGGPPRQVAVTIGPEFGPVTAWQVENALIQAYRRRVYQDLVIAGFSFDAAAQALVQDDPNPQVRCHLAHIRPDVNMGGLLKDTPNAQLFTVFGSPRTRLDQTPDGLFTVTLEGVDIYNPVDNTILATQVDKVAAWFVDSDYDGRAFCITQAFFPDKSAWDKLARALKTVVDESAFAALSGTVSLPCCSTLAASRWKSANCSACRSMW